MTLIYELDLHVVPLHLHAKIQLFVFVRLAWRERRTDRQADRQTHDIKTFTPIADARFKVEF